MMEHVHQHEDDEIHRREVVVVKQHLVERRLLELPFTFGLYSFFVLRSEYRHSAAILSYSRRLQEFGAFHPESRDLRLWVGRSRRREINPGMRAFRLPLRLKAFELARIASFG